MAVHSRLVPMPMSTSTSTPSMTTAVPEAKSSTASASVAPSASPAPASGTLRRHKPPPVRSERSKPQTNQPLVLPRLLDELSFDAEYQRGTRVWFGHVEVLEFPYALGDNPSVANGCPVSMEMRTVDRESHRISRYEQMRCPQRTRTRKQLRLSAEQRSRILYDNGVPAHQILERTAEVSKERERRQRTSRAQRCELLYERLVADKELRKKFERQMAAAEDIDTSLLLAPSPSPSNKTNQPVVGGSASRKHYSTFWSPHVFRKMLLL